MAGNTSDSHRRPLHQKSPSEANINVGVQTHRARILSKPTIRLVNNDNSIDRSIGTGSTRRRQSNVENESPVLGNYGTSVSQFQDGQTSRSLRPASVASSNYPLSPPPRYSLLGTTNSRTNTSAVPHSAVDRSELELPTVRSRWVDSIRPDHARGQTQDGQPGAGQLSNRADEAPTSSARDTPAATTLTNSYNAYNTAQRPAVLEPYHPSSPHAFSIDADLDPVHEARQVDAHSRSARAGIADAVPDRVAGAGHHDSSIAQSSSARWSGLNLLSFGLDDRLNNASRSRNTQGIDSTSSIHDPFYISSSASEADDEDHDAGRLSTFFNIDQPYQEDEAFLARPFSLRSLTPEPLRTFKRPSPDSVKLGSATHTDIVATVPRQLEDPFSVDSPTLPTQKFNKKASSASKHGRATSVSLTPGSNGTVVRRRGYTGTGGHGEQFTDYEPSSPVVSIKPSIVELTPSTISRRHFQSSVDSSSGQRGPEHIRTATATYLPDDIPTPSTQPHGLEGRDATSRTTAGPFSQDDSHGQRLHTANSDPERRRSGIVGQSTEGQVSPVSPLTGSISSLTWDPSTSIANPLLSQRTSVVSPNEPAARYAQYGVGVPLPTRRDSRIDYHLQRDASVRSRGETRQSLLWTNNARLASHLSTIHSEADVRSERPSVSANYSDSSASDKSAIADAPRSAPLPFAHRLSRTDSGFDRMFNDIDASLPGQAYYGRDDIDNGLKIFDTPSTHATGPTQTGERQPSVPQVRITSPGRTPQSRPRYAHRHTHSRLQSLTDFRNFKDTLPGWARYDNNFSSSRFAAAPLSTQPFSQTSPTSQSQTYSPRSLISPTSFPFPSMSFSPPPLSPDDAFARRVPMSPLSLHLSQSIRSRKGRFMSELPGDSSQQQKLSEEASLSATSDVPPTPVARPRPNVNRRVRSWSFDDAFAITRMQQQINASAFSSDTDLPASAPEMTEEQPQSQPREDLETLVQTQLYHVSSVKSSTKSSKSGSGSITEVRMSASALPLVGEPDFSSVWVVALESSTSSSSARSSTFAVAALRTRRSKSGRPSPSSAAGPTSHPSPAPSLTALPAPLFSYPSSTLDRRLGALAEETRKKRSPLFNAHSFAPLQSNPVNAGGRKASASSSSSDAKQRRIFRANQSGGRKGALGLRKPLPAPPSERAPTPPLRTSISAEKLAARDQFLSQISAVSFLLPPNESDETDSLSSTRVQFNDSSTSLPIPASTFERIHNELFPGSPFLQQQHSTLNSPLSPFLNYTNRSQIHTIARKPLPIRKSSPPSSFSSSTHRNRLSRFSVRSSQSRRRANIRPRSVVVPGQPADLIQRTYYSRERSPNKRLSPSRALNTKSKRSSLLSGSRALLRPLSGNPIAGIGYRKGKIVDISPRKNKATPNLPSWKDSTPPQSRSAWSTPRGPPPTVPIVPPRSILRSTPGSNQKAAAQQPRRSSMKKTSISKTPALPTGPLDFSSHPAIQQLSGKGKRKTYTHLPPTPPPKIIAPPLPVASPTGLSQARRESQAESSAAAGQRRSRASRPAGEYIPDWTPHLWHSTSEKNLRNRQSRLIEPPVDVGSEGHSLNRRNVQIVLFVLGFILPVAWWVASFLALPPRPSTPFAVSRDRRASVATMGEKAAAERPDLYTGNGHGPLAAEIDLEKGLRPYDIARWENARWWRNVNRAMSIVGVAVIIAVVVLAVVGTRLASASCNCPSNVVNAKFTA